MSMCCQAFTTTVCLADGFALRCVSDVQAEEKARKAFEKVKAKYDSALKDLQEAQAELDSKVQDRARLTEQRRLAELKIQEQVQAKQSHDVSMRSPARCCSWHRAQCRAYVVRALTHYFDVRFAGCTRSGSRLGTRRWLVKRPFACHPSPVYSLLIRFHVCIPHPNARNYALLSSSETERLDLTRSWPKYSTGSGHVKGVGRESDNFAPSSYLT